MQPSLSNADYVVIAFFFVFMAGMGWVFKRFVSTTSDYFRGGGEMVWWVAGASAFMTQFSAWTFTGAAGKAYQDGPMILAIFFGNSVGFFFNFLYFAPRFRQTRVITAIQAVRDRFGRVNEQFFTWLQLPMGILYAGIWLNGLALFLSAVFKMDIETTIWVTGLVVLFMSFAGGAWASSASDFVQMLILTSITVVAAVLCLAAVGGVGGLIESAPSHYWRPSEAANANIVWIWVAAMLIKQFTSTNSLLEASRYLQVKDSRHARGAAMLALVLFLIGPIIWFIPPWTARILYPDLPSHETAYVTAAASVLPAGMLGLLISGILAATMSSMDSGLNKNAGFFVQNFYRPILRPHASDHHLLWAGRIVTLGFGLLIIGAALFYTTLSDLSLFELMVNFGTLVSIPMAMPLIWGLVFRRAPQWAAWSTVLVGLTVSFLSNRLLNADWASRTFGWDALSPRERSDWIQLVGVLINVPTGTLWFLGTIAFAKWRSHAEVERVESFFRRVNTPVNFALEEGAGSDNRQYRTLGGLCFVYGAFILLLALIPNSPGGRLAFVFCGLMIGGVGFALWRLGVRGGKEPVPAGASKEPLAVQPEQRPALERV